MKKKRPTKIKDLEPGDEDLNIVAEVKSVECRLLKLSKTLIWWVQICFFVRLGTRLEWFGQNYRSTILT